MQQPLKSIIDKIIWAKLDIQAVVKAYTKEFKKREKYQKEIDDAQPGAEEAKEQAAKDKKNGTAPEGPDPLNPVDENDLVSPVEDDEEEDEVEPLNPAEEPEELLEPAETSNKK